MYRTHYMYIYTYKYGYSELFCCRYLPTPINGGRVLLTGGVQLSKPAHLRFLKLSLAVFILSI